MVLRGELHVGVNVGSTGCLCLHVSALVMHWQPKDEPLSIMDGKVWSIVRGQLEDLNVRFPHTYFTGIVFHKTILLLTQEGNEEHKKNSETSLLQFLAHREKGGLCLFQSIESLLCETSIKEVLHFIASIASCWAKGGLSWIRRWERYFCSKENLRVWHDNAVVTLPEYSKCDSQLKWEQIRQEGGFLLKKW